MKNAQANSENQVWSVIWNCYQLPSGGTTKINGQKVGKWIELFENFCEKSQIFHIGNYQNGVKTGKWVSQFKDKQVGGGFYTESGQKNGKWIELYDYFRDDCQIFYEGIYNHGKKLGFWSMICNNNLIGGGQYNMNGLKIGKWKELYEQLLDYQEVVIEGEYFNGIKIGFFKITKENNIIGGGDYNLIGLKIGNWIELDQCYNIDAQVYWIGLYKENIKNGIWKLKYLNQIIGGGYFNFDGSKNGNWKEISHNYSCDCQVTFRGEYKNNKKKGQWNALLNNKLIGGGRYDENQNKIGKWIELYENYWNEAQVSFTGDYHIGYKHGIWMTIFQDKIIGGGYYTNQGMKHGKWLDLYHNFQEFCQVTIQGSYMYGIKIGRWKTYFENYLIGGGDYDENGSKQGKWIELHENFDRYLFELKYFSSNTQILFCGNYLNSRKSGSWEFIYRSKIIGGGFYDENGFKHGKWIELDDDFNLSLVDPCTITYNGEYIRGLKKGKFVRIEIF